MEVPESQTQALRGEIRLFSRRNSASGSLRKIGSVLLSIGRDPINFAALLNGLWQPCQLDRTDRVFLSLYGYESD